MPHVIIEHSANVEQAVDVAELVDVMHDAALSTGVAAVDALRTRAARRDVYAVGDRHPDNAFIAVTARLGAGRDLETKRRFLETLMDRLDRHLGDAGRTMMLSVEVQEIDPDLRLNTNHLRAVIATRTTGDHDGR